MKLFEIEKERLEQINYDFVQEKIKKFLEDNYLKETKNGYRYIPIKLDIFFEVEFKKDRIKIIRDYKDFLTNVWTYNNNSDSDEDEIILSLSEGYEKIISRIDEEFRDVINNCVKFKD